MKNRSRSAAAGLLLLLAFGSSALADDGPSPAQQADWAQRLEKAAALKAQGKARQDEAEKIKAEKDAECFKRFFVNNCRAEVQAEFVAATRVGKRLEVEGKGIEREVQKEQFADRDARRQAAAPGREAELKAREAEVAADREQAEAERAANREDKAKKAEEGARRQADDTERLRKKREAHDARVAEQMEKARRRAADAGQK